MRARGAPAMRKILQVLAGAAILGFAGTEDIMFDHVSIKVARFSKSLAFYTAALAPLGMVPQFVDEAGKSAGFGPPGTVILWIAEGKSGGTVHLAFKSEKRAGVGAFYKAALGAGGKDNGPPGSRPDYSETYYAAFVLDPDGNNVEAVTFA
jgi:catechol 2,3-dioxygenase-like lactoylglutathione lyase family enzyme